MSEQRCQILNWNVRGLNGAARRKVVHDLAADTRCTIACLQETKLADVQDHIVGETLASEFRQFTVSARLKASVENSEWWVTVVYGPQGDNQKLEFLRELRAISTIVSDKWLLIGDFNLILDARDKSNSNLNRRLMSVFRDAVQDLELRELNLRGRKFTWSNDSTHTRIDRAFCTSEWDLMMLGCMLQALSSMVSDHAPLLLTGRCKLVLSGFQV